MSFQHSGFQQNAFQTGVNGEAAVPASPRRLPEIDQWAQDRQEYQARRRYGQAAAVSSDIAAVGSLTITGAANLDAIGELAAAGTLSITGTADLDGVGELLASGSLTINGVADLDATGDLLAAGSLSINGTADLDAIGELLAAGTLTITATADLDAIGELSATGSLVINGSADIDGSQPVYQVRRTYPETDLWAQDRLEWQTRRRYGIAPTADPQDISATGSLTITGAANLDAIGIPPIRRFLEDVGGLAERLVEFGTRRHSATPAPRDLDASGSISITGAADLDAIGELLATGSIVINGAADLDGVGNLSAAGSLSITGTADLDAVGELSASGSLVINGSASISTFGDLIAHGTIVITGVAELEQPVVATTPQGGDDRPDARRHPGWNRKKAQLKLTQEQELAADIRRLYRKLTDTEETREAAEAIVAEIVAPSVQLPDDSRQRTEQLRQSLVALAGRLSVEKEIALRLLHADLMRQEIERDDWEAIQITLGLV